MSYKNEFVENVYWTLIIQEITVSETTRGERESGRKDPRENNSNRTVFYIECTYGSMF